MGIVESAEKFIRSGGELVTKEQRDKRLETCKACEHFAETLSRCQLCGCFLKVKTWMASESCPDKPPRWAAEAVDATIQTQRLSICEGCPIQQKGICTHPSSGLPIEAQTRYAGQECPIGRWPSLKGPGEPQERSASPQATPTPSAPKNAPRTLGGCCHGSR